MSLRNEIVRSAVSAKGVSGGPDLRPSRQLVRDTVTSYKICVLVLIREFLETKNGGYDTDIPYTEEEKKGIMLLLMDLVKVADLSFTQLAARLAEHVNSELLEIYNNTISELVSGGSCKLYSLFDRLNDPVKDNLGNDMQEFTTLNKTSVIGVFIRSMLISFKMMSLEEVLACVVKDICRYCGDFAPKNTFRRSELSLHTPRNSAKPVPSKWQSEKRITQLAVLLEHNERDAGNPADVSEELTTLISAYPSLYKAHYVEYLNHMRVKEYAGAKHSLHQYFDKIAGEANSNNHSKEQNVEDLNRCSRYASLNLASLYARFGHRCMALHSVREAVKLAQESNDKTCLQQALIWLEHLSADRELHGLAAAKSFSLRLWEMTLSGCLIKVLKSEGFSDKPAVLFDELNKALCYQTKAGRSPRQHTEKLSQMSLTASLYTFYTHRSMASLVSQNVLHFDLSDKGINHCAEAECLALCLLSDQHFHQGEYEMAEHILNIAKESFQLPYTYSEMWRMVEQCQLFNRAHYHRDTQAMSLACQNLTALNTIEATIRRSRLHCVQRHFLKSIKLLSDLLDTEELSALTYSGIELRVRAMLELIHVYCEMRDFGSATKHIAECMEFTYNKNLMYYHALCNYYAAYIQLEQGNSTQAQLIITKNLSMLLIHGSCYDKGRAQLLYCKSKISNYNRSQSNYTQWSRDVFRHMSLCIVNLKKAEAFLHLQDALLITALLCHSDGNNDARNDYAFEYKQNESKLHLDCRGEIVIL